MSGRKVAPKLFDSQFDDLHHEHSSFARRDANEIQIFGDVLIVVFGMVYRQF